MDNLTKAQRKKNMQNIRSKGTAPEKIVMRELKKRKVYFAVHTAAIVGKPDIVFRKKIIAVFIDSDFWHGHPRRFIKPKSNIKYWREKIARNKERDKKVNKELRKNGWTVLRFWEYDIKNNPQKVINKILETLRQKQPAVAVGRLQSCGFPHSPFMRLPVKRMKITNIFPAASRKGFT